MQALAGIAGIAKEVLSKAEQMTSTGNQDHMHQSVLPSHNIPSINCTASTGTESVDFEALDNDFKRRNGLGGVCSVQRQDNMYMVFPRATEQFAHCILHEAKLFYHQYTKALDAAEANADDTADVERKLTDQALRFGELIARAVMIQALGRPNSKLIAKFIRFCKEKLGEPDGGYLDHFQDDWGSLVAIQSLDSWVRLLPESKMGEFLLSKIVTDGGSDNVASYRSYGDKALKKLFMALSIFLVAVFYAVPMVILALDLVTSLPGVICISVVWLLAFCLLLLTVVEDGGMMFFLGVGYASLLCASLKKG